MTSPSPDSLRLGILAGKIDWRMPDDWHRRAAEEIAEFAALYGPAAKTKIAEIIARHSPARADGLTEEERDILGLLRDRAHGNPHGLGAKALAIIDRLTAKPEPHIDRSVPCPTCGFVIRPREKPPFVFDEEDDAAAPPPPVSETGE